MQNFVLIKQVWERNEFKSQSELYFFSEFSRWFLFEILFFLNIPAINEPFSHSQKKKFCKTITLFRITIKSSFGKLQASVRRRKLCSDYISLLATFNSSFLPLSYFNHCKKNLGAIMRNFGTLRSEWKSLLNTQWKEKEREK